MLTMLKLGRAFSIGIGIAGITCNWNSFEYTSYCYCFKVIFGKTFKNLWYFLKISRNIGILKHDFLKIHPERPRVVETVQNKSFSVQSNELTSQCKCINLEVHKTFLIPQTVEHKKFLKKT